MLWVKHYCCTSFKQLEIKCQLQNNLYLKEYIKFISSCPLMGFLQYVNMKWKQTENEFFPSF